MGGMIDNRLVTSDQRALAERVFDAVRTCGVAVDYVIGLEREALGLAIQLASGLRRAYRVQTRDRAHEKVLGDVKAWTQKELERDQERMNGAD